MKYLQKEDQHDREGVGRQKSLQLIVHAALASKKTDGGGQGPDPRVEPEVVTQQEGRLPRKLVEGGDAALEASELEGDVRAPRREVALDLPAVEWNRSL